MLVLVAILDAMHFGISCAAEELQEATRDARGKCMTAKVQVGVILGMASGFKNNGLFFTKYPVIGYQNNLQSFGSCLQSIEGALLTACALLICNCNGVLSAIIMLRIGDILIHL